MLVGQKFRLFGLWAALTLMGMFTAYIFIMLNFTSYIPCSCGGILENMGWTEHLFFNIAFVLLAITALLLLKPRSKEVRKTVVGVTISIVASVLIVTGLYLVSEHEIHRNNSFVRRYPHHPVQQLKGYAIDYDSYYIAGFADGKIYLGNVTAPLNVLQVDTSLTSSNTLRIQLKGKTDYNFSTVQLRIMEPYFFLSDGTVPVIYRGAMADWNASRYFESPPRFSQWEPVDSNTFIIRTIDSVAQTNILGLLKNDGTAYYNKEAMRKQADGIFSTDGMLSHNDELNKAVYVYYYSNQFITATLDFRKANIGRTIDTVTKADINVVYDESARTKTISKPIPSINKYSCTSGRYLFTVSDRLGRYEEEAMLREAAIVDVYDLVKNTYEFSFYLYDYRKERVKSFQVYGNLLVALTKNHLVTYKLKASHFDLMGGQSP